MKIDFDSCKKLMDVGSPDNNRAYIMAMRAMLIHSFLAEKLKKKQSLELICTIGGREFPLHSVGPFLDNSIFVESVEEDGTSVSFFAPIEQVSFLYVVSPKKSNKPPREIGFHTMMQRAKK